MEKTIQTERNLRSTEENFRDSVQPPSYRLSQVPFTTDNEAGETSSPRQVKKITIIRKAAQSNSNNSSPTLRRNLESAGGSTARGRIERTEIDLRNMIPNRQSTPYWEAWAQCALKVNSQKEKMSPRNLKTPKSTPMNGSLPTNPFISPFIWYKEGMYRAESPNANAIVTHSEEEYTQKMREPLRIQRIENKRGQTVPSEAFGEL